VRKIDYKEGRELEKTHVCKECGGGLVVCWSPLYSHHIIRCSEGGLTINSHDGEVRKGYLNYHEQPIEIKNAMDRHEKNKQRSPNAAQMSDECRRSIIDIGKIRKERNG